MHRILLHVNSDGIGGTGRVVEVIGKHLNRKLFMPMIAVRNVVSDTEASRMWNFRQAVGEENVLDYREDFDKLRAFIHERDIRCVFAERGVAGDRPRPPELFPQKVAFLEHNVFGYYDPDPAIKGTYFVSSALRKQALPDYPGLLPRECGVIPNPLEAPEEMEPELGPHEPWVHDESCDMGEDCACAPRPMNDVPVIGRVSRPDDGIYDPLFHEMLEYLYGPLVVKILSPPPALREWVLENGFRLAQRDITFKMSVPNASPAAVSRWYRGIDVLAHSRKDGETFGLCIAEAMFHRVPVVSHPGTFNCHRDFFPPLLENNWIQDRNPILYANRVMHLLNNRKERLFQGHVAFETIKHYHHSFLLPRELGPFTLESIYARHCSRSLPK